MEFLPVHDKIRLGLAYVMLAGCGGRTAELYLTFGAPKYGAHYRFGICYVLKPLVADAGAIRLFRPCASSEWVLSGFDSEQNWHQRVIILYFGVCLFWQSVSIALVSLHVGWAFDIAGHPQGSIFTRMPLP